MEGDYMLSGGITSLQGVGTRHDVGFGKTWQKEGLDADWIPSM
jgi:hypothetical protein